MLGAGGGRESQGVPQHRFPLAPSLSRPGEGGPAATPERYRRSRRNVHLESQKGSRTLDRLPRKRGGVAGRRGISRELDCILVTRDRNKQTIDAVTGRGAVSKVQPERHLLPFLDRDVLLLSDANAAHRSFARAHGITHQAVNASAGERVRPGSHGAIHVQNVNAYHVRLREWLLPFHGVVSCYLPNYLGWRRILDGGQITSAGQLFGLAIGPIHSEP